MSNLDVIISRIQALINKAESTEFPEEAASLRAKAEQLIRKYRVEQEQLLAEDILSVTPVLVEMELCAEGRWSGWYGAIMANIARHCGIKTRSDWAMDQATGRYHIVVALVGYEGDVRYAQYLYSAARAVFASRIDVSYDPKLSEAENIYRLRSSGITRRRVASIVLGEDTHAAHAKVGKVYKDECRRRGETPALDGRGISVAVFQESYATNFLASLRTQMRRALDAADSSGGAVVLAGREERVAEAFYGFFPELRPAAVAVPEKAPAKKAKERKWTKTDERNWHRRYASAAAVAGQEAGKRAAAEVDVDRAGRASRIES